MLMYHMKHFPAMKTLLPVVDERFHKLMLKHKSGQSKKKEMATNLGEFEKI